MPDPGSARSSIANDYVDTITSRRKGNRFLISRLALFRFRQLFRRRPRGDWILKDACTATGNVSNFSENIEGCFLQTAAVFEDQVLVIGLHREGGNHALVRLAEEVDANIKVKRIVFDDWSVYRGSQIVEFNLRRPL